MASATQLRHVADERHEEYDDLEAPTVADERHTEYEEVFSQDEDSALPVVMVRPPASTFV